MKTTALSTIEMSTTEMSTMALSTTELSTTEQPLGSLPTNFEATAPDWTSRPWGRPIIHPAVGNNPNLVATCDFRYHGLKVRGVRIFRGSGGLSVTMPQKKFGDSIQNSVYFLSPDERELFFHDVTWLCAQVLGRRGQPAA